jgi:glycosyltransferase involved in cell wall biosynthesis
MATFGIAMVKDEADVIPGTLRHLADELDRLIVVDNGSTDGTRDILADLTHELPLIVVDDPDPAYYQSRKMSALAEAAAAQGATWIVPFDADELWLAEHRLADVLAGCDADIATAELTDHYCTALDGPETDPFRSMVWRRREPAPLPKVAFRWQPGAVIHQGNHGVTLPAGGTEKPLLQVRHFPYRSPQQMVRKARNGAAAYRATDLPEDQGAHWRAYGALMDLHGEHIVEDVFRQHFWYLSPTDSGLVYDPAPYCRWRP